MLGVLRGIVLSILQSVLSVGCRPCSARYGSITARWRYARWRQAAEQ
jgi:hypothetical protein